MNIESDAAFAEFLLSEEYREAKDLAFLVAPENYFDQKSSVEQLVFDALKTVRETGSPAFEIRRQAALNSLNGESVGMFETYIDGLGGTAAPSVGEAESLDAGESRVVKTNSFILSLNHSVEDPLEFLESSIQTLNRRKHSSTQNVGPENYTTALKFFTDKYRAGEGELPDEKRTRELVAQTMRGFFAVSETDKPNIVELTNVYFAIRELPAGTFGPQLTRQLLVHSIEELPKFERGTLNILLSAIHKLDVFEYGKETAVIIDLAIRKLNGFQTTREMRSALRAISNLPASRKTDNAFRAFLASLNGVETTLDIQGIEEVNERLLQIVENNVSDLDLVFDAKGLAYKCTRLAGQIAVQTSNRGALTQGQQKRLQAVVASIRETYEKM